MFPMPALCLVCRAPLSALDRPFAPTCRQPSCWWTLQVTPPERRCGVCTRPLTTPEMAARVCADARCRHRWFEERRADVLARARAARAERDREERERFEATAGRLRADAARTLAIADPERYPLTRLPRFVGRLGRLPQRRRRALRARVLALAESALARRAARSTAGDADVVAAAAVAAGDAATSPALGAVLGGGCARCRGHCCRHGGEQAYLDEATMLRWFDAHPDAGADAAADAYVAHLGARTFVGSCVYHGAGGCTLPRSMRAALCNRFLCDALREVRDAHAVGGEARAFYASERGGQLHGAFVDAREVRVARRAGAAAGA